ncbi:GMC family oxidoreductase [Ovoidimarina sediminis]|uniref:GMC family oxidoreductase n=1 Tax=Ovoidimarina sediminis TaxID=3079856 RepID=UPI00290D5E19|nr:GMC family oxidoreductase [Rhodophyticola sp. MJ-SS7]MDU8942819.1 GMC family oxidoreductase [Rhodophyticola sp. MJ-SS7]
MTAPVAEDAGALSDGEVLRPTVCIIGAGAAGLTLGTALAERGIPTLILEAGGERPDRAGQAACRAERSGTPNHSYAYSRFRALGGSTVFWTGQCVELEEADFTGRAPGVPAWPIAKSDLAEGYARAARLLDLPENGAVRARLDPGDALPQGQAALAEVRLTAVGNFADHLLAPGRPAPRILLGAAVTDLTLDAQHRRVEAVTARLPGNRSLRCEPALTVLATGGVENARLLLAANRQMPKGIGNGHDLVGRFFMDHAYMDAGVVSGTAPALARLTIPSLAAQRQAAGGFLALRLRPEGANAAAAFFTEQPDYVLHPRVATDQGQALARLAQIARGERFRDADTWGDLAALARRPDRTAALIALRALTAARGGRRTALRLFAETTPDPESRVHLSAERDALGLPRAAVHWQVPEADKAGPGRLLAEIRQRLAATGTTITGPGIGPGQPWPASLTGGKHHMGTTRMAARPEEGVVDAQARVHGIANLYIAGSSVFPTPGWANPTLTIVALALRLADRIADVLASSEP